MTPNADFKAPAMELGLMLLRLPPPWFVPIEAPACGAVLDVPAERTKDNLARRFVCDKQTGHDDKHRQVTDNELGHTIEWGVQIDGAP